MIHGLNPQMTHHASTVGSLLHFHFLRFSKERTLFFHISQLNRLIFLGQLLIQKNLTTRQRNPPSFRKLYKDFTENAPFIVRFHHFLYTVSPKFILNRSLWCRVSKFSEKGATSKRRVRSRTMPFAIAYSWILSTISTWLRYHWTNGLSKKVSHGPRWYQVKYNLLKPANS